jgi:hypothetical protein
MHKYYPTSSHPEEVLETVTRMTRKKRTVKMKKKRTVKMKMKRTTTIRMVGKVMMKKAKHLKRGSERLA